MFEAISYHPLVRIHLGPLSVSPHGVGIAVGFFLGARRLVPLLTRMGVPEDTTYALVTRAAVGSIMGARLAYVLNHLGQYLHSPLEVFALWNGGISLLGGFIGAIALGLPRMRSSKLSFWKVMDAAAPCMVLGVIVGRIGDLIVGDHLGKPTSFVLGYRCPPAHVATASDCGPTALSSRTPGLVVHQTALYDLMSAVILFLVLRWVVKRARYDGFVLLVFATWYGSMRILEDFLREDVRRFGLTGSQWTALVTVVACVYVLLVRRRTPRWGRWDEGEPPAEAAPGRIDGPAEPSVEAPTEESEWKSASE